MSIHQTCRCERHPLYNRLQSRLLVYLLHHIDLEILPREFASTIISTLLPLLLLLGRWPNMLETTCIHFHHVSPFVWTHHSRSLIPLPILNNNLGLPLGPSLPLLQSRTFRQTPSNTTAIIVILIPQIPFFMITLFPRLLLVRFILMKFQLLLPQLLHLFSFLLVANTIISINVTNLPLNLCICCLASNPQTTEILRPVYPVFRSSLLGSCLISSLLMPLLIFSRPVDMIDLSHSLRIGCA